MRLGPFDSGRRSLRAANGAETEKASRAIIYSSNEGLRLKHYRFKNSDSAVRPSLLFQVKIDWRDVRSGYRGSDFALFKGEWLQEEELSWTPDMVSPVDLDRLEPIKPPEDVYWPASAEDKIISYVIRHRRPSIWKNSGLGLYSEPSESREEFVQRCREALLEEKSAEMKKHREIFLHRFFELEHRLRKEIEEGELAEDAQSRIQARLDLLFSEGREDLSRWFASDAHAVMGDGDLDWQLDSLPEFQERIDALRSDLVSSFNEINAVFEERAEDVERYQVPVPRSAVEIVASGILWE